MTLSFIVYENEIVSNGTKKATLNAKICPF